MLNLEMKGQILNDLDKELAMSSISQKYNLWESLVCRIWNRKKEPLSVVTEDVAPTKVR